MKRLGLFSLLLLLVLAACRKDEINTTNQVTTQAPSIVTEFEGEVDEVQGSVTGIVVDEQNEPLEGVQIRFENKTYTTDAFGHFFIDDETLNAAGTFVTAKKNGYFEGSRRFFPLADKESRIKIELMTLSYDYSFEAAQGGVVSLPQGPSINFNENSIVDEDGNSYDGTVRVAARWLDPSRLSTLNRMPGALQGVNTENDEVALETYGMIAVELRGANNQELNLEKDKPATLRMPVPTSLQTGAPTTIPLWSFYDEIGLWVEESSAELINGEYVGEVSHFSFWNCDAPFPLIKLCYQLKDTDGNPIARIQTQIIRELPNRRVGYGYSDEEGFVCGKVPKNEVLELVVFNECGQEIYTQSIGPFADDTDLGMIVIDDPYINNATITGTVVDCNDDPVTNGTIVVTVGNRDFYQYIDNGTFEFTISLCNDSFDLEVVAFDLNAFEQSTPITAPLSTTTDLGTISACGIQISNFIELTVDGVTQLYAQAQVNNDSASTFISVNSPNGVYFVGFGFEGNTVGNYDNANFIEGIQDENNQWLFFRAGSFDQLDVTQYDTQIKGTFSGDLLNAADSTQVLVTGRFELDN